MVYSSFLEKVIDVALCHLGDADGGVVMVLVHDGPGTATCVVDCDVDDVLAANSEAVRIAVHVRVDKPVEQAVGTVGRQFPHSRVPLHEVEQPLHALERAQAFGCYRFQLSRAHVRLAA